MEEGSLRVDANISIRERGATKLGTKTEVKNMNSFSGVERALDAEFARQVAIVESQGRVEQETLLWDADRGTVRPARSKEGSHDYRYFPDPDLPPLRLTKEWIAGIRDRLPELPDARRRRFATEHKLSPYDVDVLTASPHIAEYFEAVAHAHGDSKTAANWVMGEVLAVLKNTGVPIDRFSVRPADLATLLDMVRGGAVSNSAAKRIFALMVQTGDRPEQIAEREGLAQVGDEAQVAAWVDEVIADKPTEWQRYLAGEKKLRQLLLNSVNKGLFTPPSLQGSIQMPGNSGGANWGLLAADPVKGRVYVMSKEAPALLTLRAMKPGDKPDDRGPDPNQLVPNAPGGFVPHTAVNPYGFMRDAATGLPPLTPPWSQLTAYDLNKGTILWQVPNGDSLQLIERGVRGTGSHQARAGMVVTAGGLVFIGTPDHKMRAYDEDTGKVIWEKGVSGPINGVPAVYEMNGRQYLAVAVGAAGTQDDDSGQSPGRTGSEYVVFALQ